MLPRRLQAADQFLDTTDRGVPEIGFRRPVIPMDRPQDPDGQRQDLVNTGPADIGQQILLRAEPGARVLVAEMLVTVPTHQAARGLEGRQQVLDPGDLVTPADERRQRRIVGAK